jgi:hypothetical protein
MMDVYVDGEKVGTIDGYSATWDWQASWTSEVLPAGRHSLRIEYASGGFTSIDGIEVIETPIILTNGVYDDEEAAIMYSGSWQKLSGGGPYLDSLHYTYRVGDSAQVYFTGRQIKLSYLAGLTAGVVDIYVDGVKVGSVDQNSDAWEWQKTWTSDLLTAGTHSLRLVYVSGGFVSVDGIEVIGEPQILTSGEHDDVEGAITYSGSWLSLTGVSGHYLESLHYTYSLGDTAQVAFTGGQIKLAYFAGPTAGMVDVYVDGVKVASLDQKNDTAWEWQKTWTSEVLSVGDHSLRLVYASGDNSFVSLDSITVLP